MGSLVILILGGLLVWFWFDSLKAREFAVNVARTTCMQKQVQFLDQSVSLESIKPKRDQYGRVVWQRVYGFDFSLQGVERRHAYVVMLGKQLKQIQMDIEEGMTIDMVD